MKRVGVIVILILVYIGYSYGQGWLSGYGYRKRITISGASGAGSGYQVLLKVGEGPGASGAHFHLEGHAENFPNDVRFTDDDGITILWYWLEKTEGSLPNRVSHFWIKVNNDLGEARNIYVYYQNPSASNISNGDSVFIFFDDFESGFNSVKWSRTDPNDVYVSGGIMQLWQNVTDRTTWLRSNVDLPSKIALEAVKKVHYNNQYYTGSFCLCDPTFSQYLAGVCYNYYFYPYDSPPCYYNHRNSFFFIPCADDGVMLSPFWQDTWFRESFKYNGDNGAVLYTRNQGSGDQSMSTTKATYTGSLRLNFWPYGWWTGHYQFIDWIAVRKYVSPEPSFSSAGSEEIPVYPPTVSNSGGATNVTANSATLNGSVVDNGRENPNVYIYWGTTDGGTNPSLWEHVENLGIRGVGPFSRTISGLSPNTRYYYRSYAINSAGDDWADESTSFVTAASIVVDWNNSNVQSITLRGDVEFSFVNGQAGGIYWLIIKQDSTGGHIAVWDDENIKWADGVPSPPPTSISPNAVDIANFVFDGFNYYGTYQRSYR